MKFFCLLTKHREGQTSDSVSKMNYYLINFVPSHFMLKGYLAVVGREELLLNSLSISYCDLLALLFLDRRDSTFISWEILQRGYGFRYLDAVLDSMRSY